MSPLSFLIPTAYIGNFQTILHWGNWLEIFMKLIKILLDLWLGVITQKYVGKKLTKARRTWSRDGKIPNVNKPWTPIHDDLHGGTLREKYMAAWRVSLSFHGQSFHWCSVGQICLTDSPCSSSKACILSHEGH